MTLIAEVERARAVLIRTMDGLTESQWTYAPGEGMWSIAQNVEHLYLAELSGVAKIWAALDDVRAGRVWSGPLPHAGLPIEAIVETTWQAREVAPPIATPHIGGPRAFWTSATRSLTPVLAELGDALEGVDLASIVFPHFLSGPLDARQRLQFLRFHIERHLGQVDRIRASPGFPL